MSASILRRGRLVDHLERGLFERKRTERSRRRHPRRTRCLRVGARIVLGKALRRGRWRRGYIGAIAGKLECGRTEDSRDQEERASVEGRSHEAAGSDYPSARVVQRASRAVDVTPRPRVHSTLPGAPSVLSSPLYLRARRKCRRARDADRTGGRQGSRAGRYGQAVRGGRDLGARSVLETASLRSRR